MDRVISLLAALVGLIALGGAILVHTNSDTQRREMATEIAALKTSISLLGGPAPAGATPMTTATPPASKPDDATAKTLVALQDRIAALEATTKSQAVELEAARAQLSAVSSASTQVAAAEPGTVVPGASSDASPSQQAATPSVITASGPTKDCIPLGTRFMGQGGDSFPLCKTKMVLKVAAVTDGIATITGAGDIAVGATVPYDKGCIVAVFSADSSGFAEMRVTCQ